MKIEVGKTYKIKGTATKVKILHRSIEHTRLGFYDFIGVLSEEGEDLSCKIGMWDISGHCYGCNPKGLARRLEPLQTPEQEQLLESIKDLEDKLNKLKEELNNG